MTTFWLTAGLLTALALAFVSLPLLRRQPSGAAVAATPANVAILREQLAELASDRKAGTLDAAQYERSVADLQRRVLQETEDAGRATPAAPVPIGRWTGWVAVAVLPLMAVLGYLSVGTPEALVAVPAAAPAVSAAGGAAHQMMPEQIVAMTERLAQRLQANPEDPDGWLMLARSFNALGRHREAADAYANLIRRVPPEAQLLADYADTLAVLNNRRLDGEPLALVERALAIDPRQTKALALAGTAAFHRGDYARAIGYWERIAALAGPDTDLGQSIRGSIAQARQLAERASTASATAAAAATAPQRTVAANGAAPAASATDTRRAAVGAGLSGVVRLSRALAEKAAPDDVVFIFARAVNGPRMPLAILRKQVRELPVAFFLDDSLAMSPATRLSAFPEVIVGARVSRSGTAMPQRGDLQGFSTAVKNGDEGVVVVIDSQVD